MLHFWQSAVGRSLVFIRSLGAEEFTIPLDATWHISNRWCLTQLPPAKIPPSERNSGKSCYLHFIFLVKGSLCSYAISPYGLVTWYLYCFICTTFPCLKVEVRIGVAVTCCNFSLGKNRLNQTCNAVTPMVRCPTQQHSKQSYGRNNILSINVSIVRENNVRN